MFVFNTVVIATHRRAGTQWAIDALRNNSPEISDTYMALEQMEGGRDAVVPLAVFRRQLLNLDGKVLINVHNLPTAEAWSGRDEWQFARTILKNSPTIYVHRDGRDVMVSLYYYMQSFSETVRNQSFADFLRGESTMAGADSGFSRPGFWAHHAKSWLGQENLLAVPYTEIETNYEATVRRMADFLNVALYPNLQPVSALGRQEGDGMIDAMLGRLGVPRGRGTGPHRQRIGRRGDWRRVFDRRDRDFFMKEAGDMMRRLGYEK
ncbi:MAG: sulfotransferase domain-containing protein [Chloroflexi bacterium]|nr:sulfotransferase domain-containing protein [Chloroflexota bacterium]